MKKNLKNRPLGHVVKINTVVKYQILNYGTKLFSAEKILENEDIKNKYLRNSRNLKLCFREVAICKKNYEYIDKKIGFL